MTSNIASHALTVRGVLPQTFGMPRKARSVPKSKRRPTFIRAWRKAKGLTLLQLSERLESLHEMEISDGQLSRIERGEQPYAQDLLEAIADVLGKEPSDLINVDPAKEDVFQSIWDTLKPIEQQQITEIAKALKRTGTEG